MFLEHDQRLFIINSLYLHHCFTEVFEKLILLILKFARYLSGIWWKIFFLASVFCHNFFLLVGVLFINLLIVYYNFFLNWLIKFTSIILILDGRLLSILGIHINIMVKYFNHTILEISSI